MDVKKYNMKGKEAGTCQVKDEVFNTKAHPQTINDIVKSQLNNERQGTVSSKTRAEVAGGGRKPWRQKGTSRARQGTIRSPLWPGGGSTFGPKPRTYDHRPTKKTNDRALQGVLTDLAATNQIRIVEKMAFDSGKAKDVRSFLKNHKVDRALIVLPEMCPEKDAKKMEAVCQSFRNLPNVKVVTPKHVNVLDLLKYGTVTTIKKEEGKEKKIVGAVMIAEEALQLLQDLASGVKQPRVEVEK